MNDLLGTLLTQPLPSAAELAASGDARASADSSFSATSSPTSGNTRQSRSRRMPRAALLRRDFSRFDKLRLVGGAWMLWAASTYLNYVALYAMGLPSLHASVGAVVATVLCSSGQLFVMRRSVSIAHWMLGLVTIGLDATLTALGIMVLIGVTLNPFVFAALWAISLLFSIAPELFVTQAREL